MADNKPQPDQKPQAEHAKAAPAPALDLAPVTAAIDRLASPSEETLDRDFRRAVFVAILNAYVQRHGCFDPKEMGLHAKNCWHCTDIALGHEYDEPPVSVPSAPVIEESRPRSKRPAHPSDEWGIELASGVRKRGFQTEDEALAFISGKPGAKVIQISGPEVMAVSSTM